MIDQAPILRLLGLLWLTLAAAALPASARSSIPADPTPETPPEAPGVPLSTPVDPDSHPARIAAAPTLDVWDGSAARSLTFQILTGRPAMPAAGVCAARDRFNAHVVAHLPANDEPLRPVGFRRLRLTGRCTLAPPAGR